jgi:hypothetical protein
VPRWLGLACLRCVRAWYWQWALAPTERLCCAWLPAAGRKNACMVRTTCCWCRCRPWVRSGHRCAVGFRFSRRHLSPVSAACVATGLSVLRVVIYVEIESTHANTAAMPSKVFVIILLIVRPSPRARTPAGSCVSMELERRRTGSDFL